jgi:hypothetical protein
MTRNARAGRTEPENRDCRRHHPCSRSTFVFKALAAFVVLVVGVGGAAQPVVAQEQAIGVPSADDPASVSDDPSLKGSKDVGDLWRFVRHKTGPPDDLASTQSAKRPFFFISPSVSSKPSTGLSVGAASTVVFVAGEPSATRISSADWAVSDSVKGQAGTGLRFRIFTPADRWFIQGDNRLAWTSLDTYSLGIVQDATAEKLKYDRSRIYDTAFLQVRPKLFVGFGLNVNDHSDVRAGSGTASSFAQSAYVAYSAQHGFAIDHQVSSGANVGTFIDTRDNPIDATRGWLAGATYRTFFDGFLGGSSTWQLLDVDVRTYKPLRRDGRQVLAVWLLGDFVTGGTAPYLDLPAIADDTYGRSARGYTTGRYRGPHLLYGELEYRVTLSANGFFGAVAFANATAIDGSTPDQKLFSTFAPAAGGGVRVLLSKRSKTNLCLDYGWGIQGSQGLYLAVRETF